MVFSSSSRPTRVDCGASVRSRPESTPSRRRAGTGGVDALDRHHLRFAEDDYAPDELRGRIAEHDPPGGAADSIGCAIPTCSPIAV